MPEECSPKPLVLTDVWRTCNKVRAAIFRGGINLWDYYRPLDPERNSLISESKFISVLTGPLKQDLGLSDQEIGQLGDYFKVHDGRILYTQFCEVIHDSVPDFAQNAPLVTGLEWEDPFHVNTLSVAEERRLQLLLTKIASLVNMRRLVLRPYFQDYELVAKNTGTVTLGHFARVLSYLGILVAADDFHLLVKKFVKDSYTVNYVAFVSAIDFITRTLDKQAMLDIGGDVLMQFPGKPLCAELPKLPRPEVGKVSTNELFGTPFVFHPVLDPPKIPMQLREVILRIQRYVLVNRVRISQFFKDFDPLSTGRITVSQFRRALDIIGVSGIQRLYLSDPEISQLVLLYADPNDPQRVCYSTFEDDIDKVFTVKELEKCPDFVVNAPPREVTELPQLGGHDWQSMAPGVRGLCEDVVEQVKFRVRKRSIQLKPIFSEYDKRNSGHVSRGQFRQALLSNGMLMSVKELDSLEARYLDDLGFNYLWFLREVDAARHQEPLYNDFVKQMKLINTRDTKGKPSSKERDIVEILAKIKGKVVRERIRVIEFLEQYDFHNAQTIAREDFCRGLSTCRFDLTPTEVETLTDVFASPQRRERVDYRRFSETVEETMTQGCLERAPLITPLQHLPTRDGDRNFLNFEERHLASMALEKLATTPHLNLESIFLDYDKHRGGTIPKRNFCRALSTRGLDRLLSTKEREMVEKCFGIERGITEEVDYRAFCQALHILHINSKRKAF